MAGDVKFMQEFQSFTQKFFNLRKAGNNARLTIETNNYEVKINLQVSIVSNPRPRASPSRQRRRERRRQARENTSAENKDEETAVNAGDSSSAHDVETLRDNPSQEIHSMVIERNFTAVEAAASASHHTVSAKLSPPVIDCICPDKEYFPEPNLLATLQRQSEIGLSLSRSMQHTDSLQRQRDRERDFEELQKLLNGK